MEMGTRDSLSPVGARVPPDAATRRIPADVGESGAERAVAAGDRGGMAVLRGFRVGGWLRMLADVARGAAKARRRAAVAAPRVARLWADRILFVSNNRFSNPER